MVRYLSRENDEPLVNIEPDTMGWMIVDVVHFPGMLKTAKLVESPRTINFQRGALHVTHAYEGTYQWRRKDKAPELTSVMESKFQVWMHPELPTGFAHAKIRLGTSFQAKEVRSYEMEWTLQDFGENASIAIPEYTAPGK
jgi:hypothetical protein